MECPKCQHENPEGKKFCRECGAKLAIACPQCNAEILPSDKFCGECGHHLSLPSQPIYKELSIDEKIDKIQRYLPKGLTEKILSQRGKIEGERKLVTVMFCDMEGYSQLSERLGPEEAYDIMDQVYEILIHKVHDYEGTVNEMTGDGIMGLFGAPIALEDAPQRAIRSALAIHREMAKFSDRLKEQYESIVPLKMRVGIHTGPVVVGTLGNDLRVEFKAVGETVNLASRTEGLAKSGATYVTEDTFKLIEGFFRFEALGEKQVKGKKEPIRVYRVIAPSTRKTRFEINAERGLPLFVGRERELELLLDGFERSKGGGGNVFSIVSDAGVGKSRLLYEFRKAVMNENVTFLEGRCLSYSKGTAYYPIIDILKSNFDIQEGDSSSKIRRKVRAGLKILEADDASSLPYFLELLSVKNSGIDKIMMTPEGKKDRILEILRRIVLRGSEIRSLIMAIEDLHWVDRSSEEALKDLIDSIPGARVFLIFTYRPEFAPTWGARSYHNQITLNRLSNRESVKMAIHLLKAERLDRNLEELVLEKTEGVPFFIEEFVKALLDLKIIERKNGDYHLTRVVQGLRIPSTIHDVIMARVDALPQSAKEVLQAGSVIEREFSYKLIKEIMGFPERKLLTSLSVLKESEHIYERGIFPESTYIFKHALTQEVVRNSILTKKKKQLHEVIGNAIENLLKENIEEYYGVLAGHYIESENYEKGARYSKLGGEKAEKTGSVNEAIDYAKKRISCLEKLPRTESLQHKAIDIRTILGLRMIDMNYFPEAQDTINPIRTLALKGAYKKRVPHVLTIVGTLEYCVNENFSQAFDYLEKALSISKELGDKASSAVVDYWLGYALSLDCKFEKATSHIEKCLEYNISVKHLSRVSTMKSLLSYLWGYFCGSLNLAYETSQDAIRIAEENADVFSKTHAYSCHGIACYGKGFFEEARNYLSKGLGLAEKMDHHYWQPAANHFLGEIYFELGEYEKAKDFFEKSVWLLEQYGYLPSWLNLNRIALARVNAFCERFDFDFERLITYVSQNKVKQYQGWIRRLMGELLLRKKDQSLIEAEDWIKQALDANEKNGMKFELGKDYCLYAEFLKRGDEKSKAKRNLERAIEIFKECGADGWVDKAGKERTALS